jgi:predicted AAA+ superfamily ATPase
MLIFQREIRERVLKRLFDNRVIILFGPRQSGKTTLIKSIAQSFANNALYIDCETTVARDALVVGDAEKFLKIIQDKKIVFLDEAQTIEYIGKILKLFVDTYPSIQIIATGSSSFELANRVGEPLTGRSYEYTLYPLSIHELHIAKKYHLERCLRFGMYPAIIDANDELALERLGNLSISYLFKDIFIFEAIRKPKLLEDLLKLLAYQIGSQVSFNELAQSLGTTKETVARYIDLLEKAFIIKRLYSFSRNKRNELKKSIKIYFLDLGIRNLIIGEMTDIAERDDKGKLFENFFIIERMKYHTNAGRYVQFYFWRTYDGDEIDLVEDYNGTLNAFECKWSKGDITPPVAWKKKYPTASWNLVTKDNLLDYFEKENTSPTI